MGETQNTNSNTIKDHRPSHGTTSEIHRTPIATQLKTTDQATVPQGRYTEHQIATQLKITDQATVPQGRYTEHQ